MARLINTKLAQEIWCTINTIFEDGTVEEKPIAVGDVIENLRYVERQEDGTNVVKTISGRIKEIKYSTPTRVSFNTARPANTFTDDCTLTALVIDASTEYNSNIVTVPAMEIVEDKGVTGVQRMGSACYVKVTLSLEYTDGTIAYQDIEVGDTLSDMHIMAGRGRSDIVGTFTVVAFGYRLLRGALVVNSLVLNSEATGTIIVDFNNILRFTELHTYKADSAEATNEILANAIDGETVKFSSDIDASATRMDVAGKELTFNLNGKEIKASNTGSSGIMVTSDGKLTLTGGGKIYTEDDYATGHSSGIVQVTGNGELVLDGVTMEAVRPDAVNKGQFAVIGTGDAQITVEDCDITAGWYTISGNGAQTTAAAVTTINGGVLKSTVDFAIYHPHAGKLIINGGEISGGMGAISANNGYIEINGGHLTTTADGDAGQWSDGTSGQAPAAINLNGRYGAVTCVITGGIIESPGADDMIIAGTKNPVTIKISGGQFAHPVKAEWCAEGYEPTTEVDADGYYGVKKIEA